MDDARETLLRLAAERGESLAELSRMIRRNPAYLHQFVHRRSPRRLMEDDRRLLARHLGVAEALLGAAASAEPELVPELVDVPFLAVRVAAGGGIAPDESLVRAEPFAPGLLRELGVAPADASLVTAAGCSMSPGIQDGDRLLVDRGDTQVGGGGVFVFRRDGLVAVKRVTREGGALRLASDNPDYPTLDVPACEVELIGRVKLLLRRPV